MTMAAPPSYRLIKFALLLLACLIAIEIDVDLEALQECVKSTPDSFIRNNSLCHSNGTEILRRRHRLGVNGSLFAQPFFAANFDSWYVRDHNHDDHLLLFPNDDDDLLQRDDMFVLDDEEEHLEGTNDVNASTTDVSSLVEPDQEDAASHLRVYLDLLASGQKEDYDESDDLSFPDDDWSDNPHVTHRPRALAHETTIETTTATKDLHSSSVDNMDSQDWEQHSLRGNYRPS